MADQPESIPASPAISSTFRQTLLWRFKDREQVRTLDKLGEMLWELVDEVGQFGASKDGESLIPYELDAVAGELRHAAGYLSDVADEGNFSALSAEERRLTVQAEKWARKALRLALAIEKAIAE